MMVSGLPPSSSIAKLENAFGLRERFVGGLPVLLVQPRERRHRQVGYDGRIVSDVAGGALGYEHSKKFGRNFREKYFACTGTGVMHIPIVRGARRSRSLKSAVIVLDGQP